MMTTSSSPPLTLTVRGVYGRPLPPYQEPSIPESKKKSHQIFERRRLDTTSAASSGCANNNDDVEEVVDPARGPDRAHFIPGQGLVGHDMYHTDYTSRSYVYEERAVLIQTVETYLSLMRSEQVGQYFGMFRADTEEESIELILEQPKFGEQLIVQGGMAGDVCIGDVFQAAAPSTLRLQVTSPRLPCNYVDRKVDSKFGPTGVRRHTLNEASAGWFCRVMQEGELQDGMTLERTAQPNPQWTLPRAAKALYGAKAHRREYLSCKPVWEESVDTLREFVNLEALGEAEWGEEAEEILEEMEQAEEKAVLEGESWCTNPFGDATSTTMGACACLSPVLLGMVFNWNGIFQ